MKNDAIEATTKKTAQKVYWYELMRTFTFTIITIDAKTNCPSIVKHPSCPKPLVAELRATKASATRSVPCQTA